MPSGGRPDRVLPRAFARLPTNAYDRVIILAPSHRVAMRRSFSVEPAVDVATPFGTVKFSPALHDRLAALPGAKFVAEAHPFEHAIDIELPLVRHYLPGCEVAAAVVGQWDCASAADVRALTDFAAAFRRLLDARTLVVVSSDFTHYGRDFDYVPFEDDVLTAPTSPSSGELSAAAGRFLLEIAEHSLRTALLGKERAGELEIPPEVRRELRRHSGAFVTLTENGQLRGCIGQIVSNRPVLETVREMAVSAGLHDPRFMPVSTNELAALRFEVSVLTEPTPVEGPGDIVIGRDGLILSKRGRQAVFLPQVAPEQGWDVPTMLMHLSLKAGLAADDWRSGASFETFRAQVFNRP